MSSQEHHEDRRVTDLRIRRVATSPNRELHTGRCGWVLVLPVDKCAGFIDAANFLSVDKESKRLGLPINLHTNECCQSKGLEIC